MKSNSTQQGQTLVETMVAVFILVMGITSALGLAVYSLKASTSINKQLIAVGLAREGIEAIKNMRDTNWLRTSLQSTCTDFSGQGGEVYCYPEWLKGHYFIPAEETETTYALSFNAKKDDMWELYQTNERFGLNYREDETIQGFYYTDGNVTSTEASSDFSRAIKLRADKFPPFDREGDLGPRLKVTSQVWWRDSSCPASDIPPTGQQCSIILETYLTNWKNY